MNVPSPILKQTRHHAETLYSSRPIADGGGRFPVEPYRSPHAPPTVAPSHPSGETEHRRDLSCAMRRTTALHKRMRPSGKVFGVRTEQRPPRRPLLCKKAMPKPPCACGRPRCRTHALRLIPIRLGLASGDDVPRQDRGFLPRPGGEDIARLKAERTC